jgi:ribonuclease HI
MVHDLFQDDTRSWNEQLVRQNFIAMDSEEILKIQPSRSMEEDMWAWAHEKSSQFSVRSAYRLLKEEQAQSDRDKEARGQSSANGRWGLLISRLKIPPKVRIFWWRVINNFLPSKAELNRRHIREESNCGACGNPSETLFHALVECPWAKRFWATVKKVTGKKLPCLHPMTWATDLLLESMCTKEESALFVCGCWSLWSSRNGREHGRHSWNLVAAVKHVAGIVEELMCMGPLGTTMVARQKVRWVPPVEGGVKIISDGRFEAADGYGAGAAVIRDRQGRVLAAQSRWYGPMHEVLVAEARAAKDGLELALQLGHQRVVLESDSSILISAIKSSTEDRSIITGIWRDIRELCRLFISFEVNFVRREANSLADRCAKEVSVDSPVRDWYDWLLEAAANDCNLLDVNCMKLPILKKNLSNKAPAASADRELEASSWAAALEVRRINTDGDSIFLSTT